MQAYIAASVGTQQRFTPVIPLFAQDDGDALVDENSDDLRLVLELDLTSCEELCAQGLTLEVFDREILGDDEVLASQLLPLKGLDLQKRAGGLFQKNLPFHTLTKPEDPVAFSLQIRARVTFDEEQPLPPGGGSVPSLPTSAPSGGLVNLSPSKHASQVRAQGGYPNMPLNDATQAHLEENARLAAPATPPVSPWKGENMRIIESRLKSGD